MKNYKLPPRKPDLLDELNALRRKRGVAYRVGNTEELEAIHLEMKAFWLRNGWSENEAEDEYQSHLKECSEPFYFQEGNPRIVYSLFGENGSVIESNLSISQLSAYNFNSIC